METGPDHYKVGLAGIILNMILFTEHVYYLEVVLEYQ